MGKAAPKVTAADKAYWKRIAKINAALEDLRRQEAAQEQPGEKIRGALRWSDVLTRSFPKAVRLTKAQQAAWEREKSSEKLNFYRTWRRLHDGTE